MASAFCAVRVAAVAVVGLGAIAALMVRLSGGWRRKVRPGPPVSPGRPATLPATHIASRCVAEQVVVSSGLAPGDEIVRDASAARIPGN